MLSKPISRGHVLYDYTHVTFSKRQNYSGEEHVVGVGAGALWGDGTALHPNCCSGYINLCFHKV